MLVLTILILCNYVLAWVLVGYVLLTKTDPRSAFGWSAILIMVPMLGIILFLLFGIGRTQSRAAAIMRSKASHQPEYRKPEISAEHNKRLPETVRMLESIGHHLTGQSLCAGNTIEPLQNGNEAYPAMLEAINQAKSHVFLVTYIFQRGVICEQFFAAFRAAAKRGVDVRILIDGIGRWYSPRLPIQELNECGVKIAWFLPPSLIPPNIMINLRDHRKVMVCDDIAFTGGMNIADYHVVEADKANSVQDLHFRCTGPIAQHLCRSFHLDWGFTTGIYDMQLPEMKATPVGSSYCRILLDGPGSDADPLNDVIVGVVCSASKCIRIITPCFLPTREIISALRTAAAKGLTVQIILPAKNNLIFVHWASQRVLPTLLKAGVKVYYQPAPFAHTKLLLIDDYYAQIGSANYDSRSLRLNFELNTEVFDRAFNSRMQDYVNNILQRSHEISLFELINQPVSIKIRNSLFWLFSPYL